MIWLIDYNIRTGKLTREQFEDSERDAVNKERFERELKALHDGIHKDTRIFTLEAACLEHVKKTHARWFC